MADKYLIHHGVEGMHWGIRRYQNADGSRINSASSTDPRRYGVYTKAASEALGKASAAANVMKNISTSNDIAARRNAAKYMSDEELRAITTRQQLENNYVNAIPASTTTSGWERTTNVLAAVGSAVGVAATALGIYKQLNDLKSGK